MSIGVNIRPPPFPISLLGDLEKGGKLMKNDYNKNNFWSCKNEESGTVKFYIKLNDSMVEVPENVYRVCFNSYMKIRNDSKKEQQMNMYSLDALNNNNHTLYDVINSDIESDIVNNIVMKDIVKTVRYTLSTMDQVDSCILQKYLFEGKSHMEIAEEMGLAKSTVTYRIKKGLINLRILIKKLVD